MVHCAVGNSFCVAMAQMCAVVCLIFRSSSDSSLVRSLMGTGAGPSAEEASGSATAGEDAGVATAETACHRGGDAGGDDGRDRDRDGARPRPRCHRRGHAARHRTEPDATRVSSHRVGFADANGARTDHCGRAGSDGAVAHATVTVPGRTRTTSDGEGDECALCHNKCRTDESADAISQISF